MQKQTYLAVDAIVEIQYSSSVIIYCMSQAFNNMAVTKIKRVEHIWSCDHKMAATIPAPYKMSTELRTVFSQIQRCAEVSECGDTFMMGKKILKKWLHPLCDLFSVK